MSEIVEFLTNDALAGDIDSQIQLGLLAMHGECIPVDLESAKHWFDTALLNTCLGVSKEAIEYHINISRYQGDLYLMMHDYESAIKKYLFVSESVESGSELYWHARIKFISAHMPTDPNKAYIMYKNVINEDVPAWVEIEVKLQIATIDMKDPVKHKSTLEDLRNVVQLMEKTDPIKYKKTITNTTNSMGLICELLGDYEQAKTHYMTAHEGGSLFASNNLAHMYEVGLGVDHDLVIAAEYYAAGGPEYVKWKKSREEWGCQ